MAVPKTIQLVVYMLLLCALGVQWAQEYRTRNLKTLNWDRLPYYLSGWQGENMQFSALFGADPADSSTLREYESRGRDIVVYVGFHADLPTTLDYHTPLLCYPAQGWKIVSESKREVGAFRGHRVTASDIVVEKNNERRVVEWWYHAGSRVYEKRLRQTLLMVGRAVVTGRTDGAIVRVETPIVDGSEENARATLHAFSPALLASLERALPQ